MPQAQQQLAAHKAAAAEQPTTIGVHDVELGRDDIAALGTQIVLRLRTEPDSVVMHVGQIFSIRQVHVLAIGAPGELLGRVQAYSGRILRNAVIVKVDTVTAQREGRTAAEFRPMAPAALLTVSLPIVVPDTAK